MNARQVIRRLMHDRWRRNLVLPNYTPAGWWECDVFELTDAGYFREYEVKLTRSDFKADQRKSRREWRTNTTRFKHDLLAQGDPRGPNRFWYVAPKGMLRPEDLPLWAGLIEVIDKGEEKHWLRRFGLLPTRAAPKIHDHRVESNVWKHAREVCYWRMHELLRCAVQPPEHSDDHPPLVEEFPPVLSL